jgi:hypothetical protein
MTPAVALVIGIAVAVLVLVLVLVNRKMERERTEALRQLAETAGLTFDPRSDVAALQARGSLQLFARGHSKRVTNVMRGRLDGQEIAVFDYQFTTGSGKNAHTTHETVVMLPAANGSLPDLQLAPENFITRIGESFGYQDIDFDSNPEFSRKYVVKGPDAAAIRARLYPNATSYFGEHEGWTVEVLSGSVGIYRANRRPKAEEMRAFIEEALGAARTL